MKVWIVCDEESQIKGVFSSVLGAEHYLKEIGDPGMITHDIEDYEVTEWKH